MKAKMIKLQVICKMNRQLCHEDKQAICPCSCKVTFSSEGDDVTLPFEFPEYQGWFDGDTLNLECKKDVALEAYEGMAETLKEIKKVEDLSFVSENGNNLLPIEVKSFELSIKFDTSEVEKGFTLPWLTGECTKTFEAKVVALKDVKPLDLYWMNRDQQGLYESGYLLTAEQLRAEVQGGAWEYLTEHPTEEYVGKYRDDDTFIVKKVRSAEEIRELMTWKNFDPQESCASGEFDEGWPIFVDKRYRLDRYIYEFTGYTYMTLPSGDENPTVKEWMERLGLTEEDLYYVPTEEEIIGKDLQDVIRHEGELTPKKYAEKLKERNKEVPNFVEYLVEFTQTISVIGVENQADEAIEEAQKSLSVEDFTPTYVGENQYDAEE